MLVQACPIRSYPSANDKLPKSKAKVTIVNPTKTTTNIAKIRAHFDLNISRFPFFDKKLIVSLMRHMLTLSLR